jgi:shikimate kinase
MARTNNIFLVGLMGSGKSTIGRHLAKSLGLAFLDSDHEIERRTGADIPLIFDVEGEAGFRQREKKIVDELSQRDGIVLATGGGAVLDSENRAHLRERGMVIYLYATVDQLLVRTAKDRNRPLLQTADPRARLQELFLARDGLYRETAEWMVDTGGRTARGIEREILAKIRAQQAAEHRSKPYARGKRRASTSEESEDDEEIGC